MSTHWIKTMRWACALLLLAASLAWAPAAAAQSPTAGPVDVAAVDAYLEQQVAANRLPGLAVAVVQDGQPVFLRGYGQAAPGRPVTPQTQLYLGSVTKSFTALAAMQLVEEGKLDLDAPVQRYLPWFRVADEAASAQITVRHLLNQTSGLSAAGDPGANDYAPTLEDEARSLQAAHLTAPVGTQFQYFNQNYRVLGLLIEQASGQSYGAYLQDHVLAPLGMAHSATGPAGATALAQGHSQTFGLPLPRPQPFRPAALPSGYVISTAEDMAHYMIALLDGGTYEGRQLVRAETLQAMLTPPDGIDSQYGMGWVVSEADTGEPVYYHDGALEGFYAFVMLLPERKLGFVLLCNQSSLFQQMAVQGPLAIGLANVLVGDTPPAAPMPSWMPLLLLPLAVADLLNHIRLFRRLPRSAAKAATRPRWRQWLGGAVSVGLPLALLLWLPALLSAAVGEPAGWGDMLGVLPDVTAWLLVGLGLDLVRGVVGVVMAQRRRQVA